MEVWAEPKARRFAIFIFISMLAYSAQDLILEPFAGAVFGMTPGETTRLSGVQHGGAPDRHDPGARHQCAAAVVANANDAMDHRRLHRLGAGRCSISRWPRWPGHRGPCPLSVWALGVTNGVYAIAAIGAMMNLVDAGQRNREGTRMGLWGARAGDLVRHRRLAGNAGQRRRAIRSRLAVACLFVRLWNRGVPVRTGRLSRDLDRQAAGKQSAGNRLARQSGSVSMTDLTTFDVAIVGGGPAGAPQRTISLARDTGCCCSTAPAASSHAAAPSRHG